MSLSFGAAPVWQIGAEGGLWDQPVRMGQLVLAPAERADVIVDFRRLAGQTMTLTNSIPAAPVSTPAPPLATVMQFRVGTRVTRRGPHEIPDHLPGSAARLPAPSVTRFITLNEVVPETADWFLNLNSVRFGESVQKPRAGAVEDWVYVNLTGDTHPMHPHLVNFQVIGQTPFDADAYTKAHGGPDGVPGGIDPRPFAASSRSRCRPRRIS